jgi:hypothetical protein
MKKILLSFVASALFFVVAALSPNGTQAQTGVCADLQCPTGSYRSPLGNNMCECIEDVQAEPSGPPRVTDELLDSFDPLKTAGSPHAETFSTPGGIISRLLQFAFPLAGMILFVMIVVGGFQILSGGGSPEAMKAGQERVTMAIVGFLLLFASYWIAQLLEEILNIKIL